MPETEPRFSNVLRPGQLAPLSASPAYARFLQALAYYRADAPYLTVDKCAERCQQLSLLLTAAALASGAWPPADPG